MERAIGSSWKTEPLPVQRRELNYRRSFNQCEFERVAFGLVPGQMEDKWFVLFEESWLFFYRSWTGYCIYGVKLAQAGDGAEVVDSWVTGDLQIYRAGQPSFDFRVLDTIIDRMVSDQARGMDS